MPDLPKFFANNRYKVISKIGDGFTGSVFLAQDEATDEKVAIKYASPKTSANYSLLKRFDLENKILENLNHRHLVKFLNYSFENGRPFLVMEYVEGVNFSDWLANNRSPINICKILIQLLECLKYLHSKGIVHRDLKPSNLMIMNTKSGFHLKLIDLGFARLLEHSERITITGEIVGTPAFIAPEQIKANEKIDHRVDIFSFGIIAFEAFTGQLPFVGRTPSEMVYAIYSEPPRNFKELNHESPDELVQLINSCLKKKAYLRPMNASILIQNLKEILQILKKLKQK